MDTSQHGAPQNGCNAEASMLRAFARLVAIELAAIVRPETARPYSSDPRDPHLPPGWSKRQWDDRGRLPKTDPRRPPLRKNPRGYSCPVDIFDAWAAENEKARKVRARGVVKTETDAERRARQLAGIGLRKAG